MRVVIFTHPRFLDSTSMPLFADMITLGAVRNGDQVEIWSPRAFLFDLPAPRAAKKWLGYLDQYLLFPMHVRKRLRKTTADTLFVFSDQALGPWLPLVAHRPHVIHCHDFMALRSALGEFPQNPVSWTGGLYQRWICAGFRKGRNFISVSGRTREDLHRFFGEMKPELSVVIYNGLNHPYQPLSVDEAHARLRSIGITPPHEGFILHVGGNQWYKNRGGVLAIYAAYVRRVIDPLPLFMLGAAPNDELRVAAKEVPASGKVEFVVRPPTQILEAAYSAASALLFPSYAEGFGWPIIEAMACGCPVLTTDAAPMKEVGGDVADYLPMPPADDVQAWADICAVRLVEVLSRSTAAHAASRQAGISHAQGFSAENTVRRYLEIYTRILGGGAR